MTVYNDYLRVSKYKIRGKIMKIKQTQSADYSFLLFGLVQPKHRVENFRVLFTRSAFREDKIYGLT